MAALRYLLLQIRNQDDPIRNQEVDCFASALDCSQQQITTLNLLSDRLTEARLNSVDAVLIGGSGDYSAAGNSPWLEQTLADLRLLHELNKPTFGSCWGFQAIARAMGGRCIHDPPHAELGSIELKLTSAGIEDPLFKELDQTFLGLAGHEDHVVELPPRATLLASSKLVTNQAFKFEDAPIYCTQFHPELDRETFLQRVAAYPQYVEKIAGMSVSDFAERCGDATQSRQLLKRFAQFVTELLQETNQ